MDLRHAAQAVGVLHPPALAVRLADGAALEEAPQVAGGGRLAGVGPRGVDARVEGDVGALEGVEGQGTDDVGRASQAPGLGHREAADRGHELRPVDEGQPLLRLEHERAEAGGAEAVGAREPALLEDALALADQDEGEVGERGEVAARADRALRRDDRVDAAVQQLDEELEGLEPDAGEALGQHVRAEEDEGARLLRPERGPDAGGVRAEEVQLELAQAVEGNVHVGEVAEAGRDAVDDRPARDGVVHDASRGPHRVPRGGGEDDGPAPAGDRLEAVEIEAPAVDREGRSRGEGAHGGDAAV